MCNFHKNRLRHRIFCCVVLTNIENTQTFFSQPFCISFVLDCTNSSFYLLFTLTKKQSGYCRLFVYYNVPVKWFTKTVSFYGAQHAAGYIANVWAVNNIQLYVSLFMRGLACFRSCFTLFSLSHYLYYTTRARGMSNGTASFEYHIFKYSLYFSKYS